MGTAKKATTMTTATAVTGSLVSSKSVSTIMDVWGKSADENKQEELAINFELLRADADTDLLHKKRNVMGADKSVKDSLMAAAKSPNFNKIAEAQLELEEAQLVLKRAITTYESLFGESPRVSA